MSRRVKLSHSVKRDANYFSFYYYSHMDDEDVVNAGLCVESRRERI